MPVRQLDHLDLLKGIRISLDNSQEVSRATLDKLEILIIENSRLYEAVQLLESAIRSIPPPQVTVPEIKLPRFEIPQAAPLPEVSTFFESLYTLFQQNQSANKVVLDQIREIVKSQISEDKQPTRIMAGSPSSIRLQSKDGVVVGNQTTDQPLIPKGFDQQTLAGTAQGLTVPQNAIYAMIQTESAIRYRDDGTDPTTTVGIQLPAQAAVFYTGDLSKFKMIAVVAAVVNIAYYGV